MDNDMPDLLGSLAGGFLEDSGAYAPHLQPLGRARGVTNLTQDIDFAAYGLDEQNFMMNRGNGNIATNVNDRPTSRDCFTTSLRNSEGPLPKLSNGKSRVTGGRPAVPKKIVAADLDSDDEMIYNLKGQGEKDERIVERMVSEGRMKYAPKTISTRYNRIKRVMQEAEEEAAEIDFSDWHEDEDDMIIDAWIESREEIMRVLEMLNERQYDRMFDSLKIKMGRTKAKHSRRLIRERLEALFSGTAKIPVERDKNPEQRRAETAARVTLRQADAREKADQQHRDEEGRRAIQEEKDRQVAEERDKKENIRRFEAEEKKIVAAQKAAANADRRRRANETAEERAKRSWEYQTRTERNKAERKVKSDELAVKRRQAVQDRAQKLVQDRLAKAERARRVEEARLHKLTTERTCRDILFENMKDSLEEVVLSIRDEDESNKQHEKLEKGLLATARSPSAIPTRENRPPREDPTSPPAERLQPSNPRSTMSHWQLLAVASSRGLQAEETSEQLVEALEKLDASLSLAELQAILKERNLKSSGTKLELARRIAANDAGHMVPQAGAPRARKKAKAAVT